MARNLFLQELALGIHQFFEQRMSIYIWCSPGDGCSRSKLVPGRGFCGNGISFQLKLIFFWSGFGGIIAGDFFPEDDLLVDRNKLVYAWIALHRKHPNGDTWSVVVEPRDGLGPGRLDRVVLLSLKAKETEVFRPGRRAKKTKSLSRSLGVTIPG
ncbi:hypothetical protein BDP27DRAFT_1333265 [Rhodocollybia butyracea]|uniref:Uncharacterized protein n=1 Tax=Rhodocollybia butyracea TaxID=206335 RepID=A0A9P5U4E5_9AGAR|nr:hypothetical protein BDP27DRAFT_1333265 [Rhodocollybia butyracea]